MNKIIKVLSSRTNASPVNKSNVHKRCMSQLKSILKRIGFLVIQT